MGFGNLGRYPRKRSMAISLTWETVPINKYIAYFRAKYMLIMVCIYTEKKNQSFFFSFFFEKMFLVCKTLNFLHPGMLCATFGCIWPSGPRVILEKSSMQFCYFVIIPQGKRQLTLHLNKLRNNNLTVTRLRSVTVKPGEHICIAWSFCKRIRHKFWKT